MQATMLGTVAGNPSLQALSRDGNSILHANLNIPRELQKKMMMQ
jgi:hypothetical protein